VVFPVVITFGVDSPGFAPGKANSYRRCAPVNGNVASNNNNNNTIAAQKRCLSPSLCAKTVF